MEVRGGTNAIKVLMYNNEVSSISSSGFDLRRSFHHVTYSDVESSCST